ncbi:hypothetical protein [Streptomyces olivochromogenes]|uniref:hypothetical protein n=1 Tax=Streptomyces olivochromogenes TaxID=1963 RepID=UPI001F33CB93|nr:hypothetical protein [Streptomyces olivochromogenes]
MFSADEMSRALGSIGPVMGLAAVCGPVLGGVLTHADLFGSSWRAVFLVNVPVSVAVLALAPRLPENRAPRRPTLDVTGTLLAATGTGLVVHPLIGTNVVELRPRGWTSLCAGLPSSLCWFRGGTTDSFGPEPRPLTDAPGFLPYANGAHYDTAWGRRPLPGV